MDGEGSVSAAKGAGVPAKPARPFKAGDVQARPGIGDGGARAAAGGWTALAVRQGVGSDASFLARPAAQEAATGAYLRCARALLDRNGSLVRSGGAVTGLDGTPVPLTEAGLVSAAHRRGAGSVARYLAHRAAAASAPDAPPLSAQDRRAFAAVERRLRDFAELPYAVAARPGLRAAPAA